MWLKRKILIGLIVLFLVSTGCSSDKNQINQTAITLNWHYMLGGISKKEKRDEINQYLKEINSGYQIHFVNIVDMIPFDAKTENLVYTSMSTRILDYLTKLRDDHEKVDIVNVNQLGTMDFSRNYLVKEGLLTELDVYFENSDAGQIIYNTYPEIIFESMKIDGKSYLIPGALSDLIAGKQSCMDSRAYMAMETDKLNQYDFNEPLGYNLSQYNEFLRSIGDQENEQLLIYNSFGIMNNFPYLTPVCGSSLRVSPFVIDEKTKTVQIIYDCQDWLETLSTFQELYKDDYYVSDRYSFETDAIIQYNYFPDEQIENKSIVAENSQYIKVIPYWGLAIPSWCDQKEEVMNFFKLLYTDPQLSSLFFEDGFDVGGKIFRGMGNPYIVEGSILPQNLTKENHQKFYEASNKSCAFGLTFDFSHYFEEMQDLVVKHNEYFTSYNAPELIDMELYKEVMKETRIEEIRDDLNNQLQIYLSGK